MTAIDRVAQTNTWSGRHPVDKLVLAGGLVLLAVALPPLPGAALVLAATLIIAVSGPRIDPADVLRLLMVPLTFILASGLVLAVSVRLTGAGPFLTVSAEGATTALAVSIRALAATAALLLLAMTTPIADLLALLRAMRVPAPLVEMVLLVYRFVSLVAAVAEGMRIAQVSRLGYAGFSHSVRSAGLLAAVLLPRSLDRAQRLQLGLEARAYQGELRFLAHARRPSLRFIAAALALQALIAAASVLAALGARMP